MLEPSACQDMQPNMKLKSLIVTEERHYGDQASSSPTKKNFKTELILVQSDCGRKMKLLLNSCNL